MTRPGRDRERTIDLAAHDNEAELGDGADIRVEHAPDDPIVVIPDPASDRATGTPWSRRRVLLAVAGAIGVLVAAIVVGGAVTRDDRRSGVRATSGDASGEGAEVAPSSSVPRSTTVALGPDGTPILSAPGGDAAPDGPAPTAASPQPEPQAVPQAPPATDAAPAPAPAPIAPTVPAPPPAPASFAVSVTPATLTVAAGQPAAVTLRVHNTGGTSGQYVYDNDGCDPAVAPSPGQMCTQIAQQVDVAPGVEASVTRTILTTGATAGTYTVDVGGAIVTVTIT